MMSYFLREYWVEGSEIKESSFFEMTLILFPEYSDALA